MTGLESDREFVEKQNEIYTSDHFKDYEPPVHWESSKIRRLLRIITALQKEVEHYKHCYQSAMYDLREVRKRCKEK
jgi:dynactin complex subunit